jgi:hypothetical protein
MDKGVICIVSIVQSLVLKIILKRNGFCSQKTQRLICIYGWRVLLIIVYVRKPNRKNNILPLIEQTSESHEVNL